MATRYRKKPFSTKKRSSKRVRRTTYKRPAARPRRNVINRRTVNAGLGFPKKMLMTHKFIQNQIISSPAGAMTFINFSCNGMYDPQLAFGGHQPMYFDQMTTLYNHYIVIGSKIKVTLPPSDQNYMAVIYLNDDAVQLPTSWDWANENSLGRSVMVLHTAARPTVLTAKWSAKKIFGGSILANDALQGTAAANPTEQTTYTIMIQTVDKITSTSPVYAKVEMEFIAVWRELKEVNQS